MSIDLLQEIGLNKYEAEAYYTLLTQGPLTGYELGKRSQVPLSRSYDVLERLSQKGLALAQPGDPARYMALEPRLFLGQVRAGMEHTLNALAETLTAAQQAGNAGEFWVVRGRQHILARVKTLCTTATQTVQLALPKACLDELTDSLAQARQRGCTISLNTEQTSGATNVSLLIDGREGLLGTIAPEASCQAVLSTNPSLLAVLASFFQPARLTPVIQTTEQMVPSPSDEQSNWLDWENRKQQRLWKSRARTA